VVSVTERRGRSTAVRKGTGRHYIKSQIILLFDGAALEHTNHNLILAQIAYKKMNSLT
jgi:hypothetical protein